MQLIHEEEMQSFLWLIDWTKGYIQQVLDDHRRRHEAGEIPAEIVKLIEHHQAELQRLEAHYNYLNKT